MEGGKDEGPARVRPIRRAHWVGFAALALAVAALVYAYWSGTTEAALLAVPALVLFPYEADALVILLYRAGLISEASANRLGCLHVAAVAIWVAVTLLAFFTNSPGLVILYFPSMLLLAYREDFIGALRRTPAQDDVARDDIPAGAFATVTPRAPTRSERIGRRLVVVTMPLCLLGLVGVLYASVGEDGLPLVILGFGPPVIAIVAYAIVRRLKVP